jgi:hypothetical protein
MTQERIDRAAEEKTDIPDRKICGRLKVTVSCSSAVVYSMEVVGSGREIVFII